MQDIQKDLTNIIDASPKSNLTVAKLIYARNSVSPAEHQIESSIELICKSQNTNEKYNLSFYYEKANLK